MTKISDFFPEISDILQKNSEIIFEKSKIFLRALSHPPISLPIDMKKVLFTLLFLLASIATFAQQSPAKSQLPAVMLRNLEGKSVKTDTLSNAGRPLIISFFATWCKPCNRELSAISEVYEDWQRETGVRVIAVSIDEGQNTEKVRPFVASKGWDFDILLDPNSNFRRAMGVNLIPHVLVLDGQGKVVLSRSGYTEGGEEHLIEKVRELVKQ